MAPPEDLPKMTYRFLGRSGLQVSAISIGGWLTYGGYTEQVASTSSTAPKLIPVSNPTLPEAIIVVEGSTEDENGTDVKVR
ncbi:hypothetical protein O1611_g9862 [Lasiodiplodia mahajangana]|uniref:Uncharacterized protein n=1 Tax=Lasiodiplodia mahajangana TaxID=1108764 RepID=A0ACC2J5B0_9PEZI|nr:hypothetical protein O1611_g9862 [Lasiodiplodia mahajangana]